LGWKAQLEGLWGFTWQGIAYWQGLWYA
jgi:hypothetical protein